MSATSSQTTADSTCVQILTFRPSASRNRGAGPKEHVGGRVGWLWYLPWAGLLAASVTNALVSETVPAAKAVLWASAILLPAAIALQIVRREALGKCEAGLGLFVLVMFCIGQLVHLATLQAGIGTKYGSDFSAYYIAGKVTTEKSAQTLYDLPLLADGRMNLHTLDAAGTGWYAAAQKYDVPYASPYIYPPFFATLMIPFAHLSFAHALMAWNIMTAFLVIATVPLAFSMAGVRMNDRLALLIGVGLFSFYPFLTGIFCGQIGGVILFLFSAGAWLLMKRQDYLSSFTFALATLIKVTPVLVLPLLVLHRRWRWLIAYSVWSIVLVGISVRVSGWAAYTQFWHSALPAISSGSAVWENTSLASWIQQLFLGYAPHATAQAQVVPVLACRISKLVSLIVYAGFLFLCWMRRNENNLDHQIIAMALLGLAISPISWWHHYVIALLPFMYFWCTMERGAGRLGLTLLVFAVGTNLIGIAGTIFDTSRLLPALAAVTPILTVGVCFAAIGKRPRIVRVY